MELLVALVVLAVLGFGFFGLVGLLGLGAMGRSAEKRRAHAVAGKAATVDALFDGRPVVTYRVNAETVPAELLIEEGGARGYELTARNAVTPGGVASDLVFTKRA